MWCQYYEPESSLPCHSWDVAFIHLTSCTLGAGSYRIPYCVPCCDPNLFAFRCWGGRIADCYRADLGVTHVRLFVTSTTFEVLLSFLAAACGLNTTIFQPRFRPPSLAFILKLTVFLEIPVTYRTYNSQLVKTGDLNMEDLGCGNVPGISLLDSCLPAFVWSSSSPCICLHLVFVSI